MRDSKHMRDIPHGMIVYYGITISILFSLFVQLVNVTLSKSVVVIFL